MSYLSNLPELFYHGPHSPQPSSLADLPPQTPRLPVPPTSLHALPKSKSHVIRSICCHQKNHLLGTNRKPNVNITYTYTSPSHWKLSIRRRSFPCENTFKMDLISRFVSFTTHPRLIMTTAWQSYSGRFYPQLKFHGTIGLSSASIPICSMYGTFTYKTGWFLGQMFGNIPYVEHMG